MDQFATGATTKDLEAVAARVAPYGWHIEINIAKSADWVELEPRLKRCPVPLVFDHLGRVRGGELVTRLTTGPSVSENVNKPMDYRIALHFE